MVIEGMLWLKVKYEEIPGVIHRIDLRDSTFVESIY